MSSLGGRGGAVEEGRIEGRNPPMKLSSIGPSCSTGVNLPSGPLTGALTWALSYRRKAQKDSAAGEDSIDLPSEPVVGLATLDCP